MFHIKTCCAGPTENKNWKISQNAVFIGTVCHDGYLCSTVASQQEGARFNPQVKVIWVDAVWSFASLCVDLKSAKIIKPLVDKTAEKI